MKVISKNKLTKWMSKQNAENHFIDRNTMRMVKNFIRSMPVYEIEVSDEDKLKQDNEEK